MATDDAPTRVLQVDAGGRGQVDQLFAQGLGAAGGTGVSTWPSS